MVLLRFHLGIAVLLILAGSVAACPVTVGGCAIVLDGPLCVMPPSAPRGVSGSYDASRQMLTISWLAPTSGTPDSYNVYRDDALAATTTTTSYSENLATISGIHYYYVKAVASSVESPQSDTLWVAKGGGGVPGVPCDPLSLAIYTYPPFVAYGIRDECLP
ncbi:MAG: hypothetical protein V4510_03555 [bacterium]